MRNTTDGGQRVGGATRQTYLSIAGRRVNPRAPEQILPPGTGATLALRFPLDAGARALLTRSGGRADLGLVPFSTARSGETPRRIGVIRLAL